MIPHFADTDQSTLFLIELELDGQRQGEQPIAPVVERIAKSACSAEGRPVALATTRGSRSLPGYLTVIATLFTALLVPFLGGLEWVGYKLGATTPLSTIAVQQQSPDKMLWLGAFRDYAPYKLERIKLVRPEVLLVGSSRCGQAREQMFRPYKAYNACLTAWPLDHAVDFIDRATREAKPRVVILALDYFLFGDVLADAWRKERAMDYRQGIDSHRKKLHDIIDFAARSYWNPSSLLTPLEKDQFEPIDNNRLVGTEAIRGHFGFRSDGSVFVAPAYRNTSATELARGAASVTSAFPGGEHLSETQFKQLERLSQLAVDRGFSVVAIQYPFLKAASDFLDTNQSYWLHAGLWRELRSEATATRFEKLGIKFFDMSRDPLAADNANFFDPAHPSERGMLRTVISLLDREEFRELFPQIDKAALKSDLQKSLSSNDLFDVYH
jgi:hypothetical protein